MNPLFVCLGSQQLEDPRVQWRKKRETMLCDYLSVVQSDLKVGKTAVTFLGRCY